MAVEVERRRFSVDEYEQMARVGILGEDDRVELLDGEIVKMTPIGLRHADCVNRLNRSLLMAYGDDAVVLVQNPIRLSDWSEPQPDLALVRPRAGLYSSSHPQPADVLLVVEVAGTTLEFDRRVKTPLYARGGVPEVWLVDLSEETVTVYRDPRRTSYRSTHTARRGDNLSPAAFPDRAVPVADILPE